MIPLIEQVASQLPNIRSFVVLEGESEIPGEFIAGIRQLRDLARAGGR